MNDIDQLLSTLVDADIALSNAEEALSAIETAKNELSNIRSLIDKADIGNSRAERLIEAIRAALATYDE